MEQNLDPSAQNLAIAICFILVAYIFYYLGSSHSTIPISAPNTEPNCLDIGLSDIKPPGTESEYLRGFRDGRKAFLSLGIHDIQQEAKQESRKLGRKLKKKLEEVEKQEKARQQWFEDELETRWRRKQAEEKGIVGWFRFGGKKRVKTEVEGGPQQRPIEEKNSEEEWMDEKAVVKSG